jgi:ketosteroid isomerase-like protein
MKAGSRVMQGAALAGAALIGYLFGSWGPAQASAARDQGRELIDLDREFDAATARNGVSGWLMYFADDGVMLPEGSQPVVGRAAIKRFLEPRFSSPGFSLRWEPIDAYASGDLGYTYGVSKALRAEADGGVTASYGKYVTIWRKRKGAGWKAALDIGNASPAPGKQPGGAR